MRLERSRGADGEILQSTRGAANRLLSQKGGRLLSWGWNGDAMLCQGHDDLVPDLPCLALGMPRTIFVETISVGATHVLAICAGATVRAWGSNAFGQLGVAVDAKDESEKKLVANPVRIGSFGPSLSPTHIAAGRNFSVVVASAPSTHKRPPWEAPQKCTRLAAPPTESLASRQFQISRVPSRRILL